MNPQGGGPSEGIRQVSAALAALGHTTECLTGDDPRASWLKDQPIKIHAVGPARAGNFRYCPRMSEWLRENASGYDAFVISGLWQHHGIAARSTLQRLNRHYFIFLHGMLDPWFKHAYPLKHVKKWLYWPWADYRVIRDAKAVLFTSEEERLRSRESFWLYRANERVVSYGTCPPPSDAERYRDLYLHSYPELYKKHILLFLGRIHEKKGCDLLLEAFAKVAARDRAMHLVIAGPDQSGWLATLKARAAELLIADRVSWPGMLQGDMKWGAFYASSAFLLPSHQENFGIAVAEALGCGLPVLISDKVNIWREIDSDGAGLVESDTGPGTLRLLERWLSLTSDERTAMRSRASDCFNRRFTAAAMATSLLEVINEPA